LTGELISKHLALFLAKVAPFVGAFAFIASVEATPTAESPWLTLWRIGLTAAIGIFVGLAGAIYHNVTNRIGSLEKLAKDDLVPRREHAVELKGIKEQLDRIEHQRRR